MPYKVNFTDVTIHPDPITVFDNTSSTDTSLTFPGRNVTGYGQIIAENFLHLLENFASGNEPVNPVEGQLWYDSTNGTLMIWTILLGKQPAIFKSLQQSLQFKHQRLVNYGLIQLINSCVFSLEHDGF